MFEFWKTPAWAPDTGDGGDPGAGGGEDTGAGGGGEDTQAGGGGDDTGAGGGAKWWEGDRFNDAQRTSLTALGLTVDDPLDALPKLLDMERSAKQRLGAAPDQLMTKPKEGQDVAEWLRENGETFGIPEDPDGYEVSKPQDWPKDLPWDEALESEARKIAHEEGVPSGALNRMVALYAGKLQSLAGGAEDALTESSQQMMTELQRDWGDQAVGKITQARQAFQMVAQNAGLDEAAQLAAAAVLTEKAGGDANVLRLFAAIGEMAGEDSLVGLTAGVGGLTTTPAEARQKVAAMQAPDSDYQKAMKAKQETGASAEFDRLHQEYLRLQKLGNG